MLWLTHCFAPSITITRPDMRATSALRGSVGLVAGATSALLAVAAGQTTEITTNTTLAPENDRNITENEVNSPLEAHFESSAVIFGLILAGFLLVCG